MMSSGILFRGGSLFLPDRIVSGVPVAVEGGRITALGKEALRRGRRRARALGRVDLEGRCLAPGFIDLHTHGALGIDFNSAGAAELEKVVREHYLPHGVTRLLASLYPGPKREFLAALERLASAIAGGAGLGTAAGLHLEGPFLDPGHPGALPRRHFRTYSPRLLEEYLRAGRGLVRTMTLAPERPGGLELVRHLRRRRVVPAFGHSGAGYEEARRAIQAGIRYVTHLFNAMDGIHHRRPGPVSAFLEDERVRVELISDGFHVDPAVLRWVERLKPGDLICLVSDSVHPCGLEDGLYVFAGVDVELKAGRVARRNGTLAGSALTLDRALRVQVEAVGADPAAAVTALTRAPARLLGWKDAGEIAPGRGADLVVLSSRLVVEETYLRGQRVYRRG
ncbi:MAG: N-acetylglucosamine-6-phosphate deacetylase [Planctomycetes bacterium]|nr:N-acetylglucosamine-6-phosphate deacetylase [Planctomycetota bacterium]